VLQPFEQGENTLFLRNVALICAAICFALALFFDSRTGHMIGDPITIDTTRLPVTQTITVPDIPGPVLLTLEGSAHLPPPRGAQPGDGHWARVEANLFDAQGTPIRGARTTVRVGGQAEGSTPTDWNSRVFTMEHPMSGTYQVALNTAEQRGYSTLQPQPRLEGGTITLTLTGGISSGYWLYRLALVFAVVAAYDLIRRTWHRLARWSGSDWTSES
jgi:hypothetical protein